MQNPGVETSQDHGEKFALKLLGAVRRGPAVSLRGTPPNFYRYAFTTYCCTMRWVLKKAPLMAMAPYMARIKAWRSR